MPKKDAYSYPEYCQIAYNWDRGPECDFIEECIKRYSDIKVGAILDIACGTGIHLREFARRGYEVLGLDASKEMAEFVIKKAEVEGLNIRCIRADMREFRLDRRFECAICMLDSFRYLLTQKDMLSHLESVGRSLKTGGLYILDFWMPKEEGRLEWEEHHWVQQEKDISIEASYLQIARTFNPKDRTFEDDVAFKIRSPNFNSTINSRRRTRLLFPGEFKGLVRKSKFFDYVDKFYNFDFDLKEGYNIKAIRTIIILRRKGD